MYTSLDELPLLKNLKMTDFEPTVILNTIFDVIRIPSLTTNVLRFNRVEQKFFLEPDL